MEGTMVGDDVVAIEGANTFVGVLKNGAIAILLLYLFACELFLEV